MSEDAQHVLVITDVRDEGPGWDGTSRFAYDYEVRHADSCKTETFDDDLGGGAVTVYTCLTQHCLDGNSIDDLTENGRERIEPGDYPIYGWSSYQPSTPMGPEEWDAGLAFVSEDGSPVRLETA